MNATVTAGVVVERKREAGSEVLFVPREDGTVGIPIGHLEEGETPRQCAMREFREETGHDIVLESLIKIVTITRRDIGPHVTFLFSGVIGEKIGEPEREVIWLSRSKIVEFEASCTIACLEIHIPALYNWGETYDLRAIEERPFPEDVSWDIA